MPTARSTVLRAVVCLYAAVLAMAPLVWHHTGPEPSNRIDAWARAAFGPDLTQALTDAHLGWPSDRYFLPFAHLGDPITVFGAIGLLAVACLVLRDRIGLALCTLGPVSAIVLTEFVLKPLVHRVDGPLMYPSGHCTASSAVATATILLLYRHGDRPAIRRIGWLVALAPVAVFVSVQRLRWHDLLDSLAGLAVGVATVLLVATLVSRRDQESNIRTTLGIMPS